MWKRKHKDVLKMENTFPWANQTSKHICCWKTRKLGFHTKPKRCSSNSFYFLLPNLRSLNPSGYFKSILEAWQKILPISLPSKIHTLQVQSHTQHHRIKKKTTKPQPNNYKKIKPTPSPPQKQNNLPSTLQRQAAFNLFRWCYLHSAGTHRAETASLPAQRAVLRVKSQFLNAIFNIFPTERQSSKYNRWKNRI